MKTLLPERPFAEGWHLCVNVDGVTLYVTPTLFETEAKAEHWRKRYQENVVSRTVYLKSVEVEEKR